MLTLEAFMAYDFYVQQIKDVSSLEKIREEMRKKFPTLDEYSFQQKVAAEHFWHFGLKENLNPSPLFDLKYYQSQVGNNNAGVQHFLEVGHKTFSPSPLFDIKFYAEQAEIPEAQALQHFLVQGAAQGINPCVLFDLTYYEKVSGVLPEKGLIHYLTEGAKNGLSPHPYFDPDFYIGQLNNNNVTRETALSYFLSSQDKDETITPSPYFDREYYAWLNHIDKKAAFIHFIKEGLEKRLSPSPYVHEGTEPSIYFDADFYVQQLNDPKVNRENALYHFLTEGLKKGFNPSSVFDIKFYGAHAKVQPHQALFHFLSEGAAKLMNPSLLFEIEFYLEQAEVARHQALEHFLRQGIYNGVNPNPFFDVDDYAKKNNLLPEKTLSHYLLKGAKAGLKPSFYFEPNYYAKKYKDKGVTIENALVHFLTEGEKEGLIPTPYFDSKYYGKDFRHFILYGEAAGKSPMPLISAEYYAAKVGVNTENACRHFLTYGAAQRIDPSLYFSVSYYAQRYGISSEQALFHFLDEGREKGNKPSLMIDSFTTLKEFKISVLFDVNYYSEQAGVSPEKSLEHFLRAGIFQGLNPNPFFDVNYYATTYHVKIEEALIHYFSIGAKQGLNPSPFFDAQYYANKNNLSLENAFIHFLTEGEKKNLSPTPYFEAEYYQTQVIGGIRNISAFRHFILIGEDAGYSPSPFFDPQFYQQQANINVMYISAIRHYLTEGRFKGLNPCVIFDAQFYIKHDRKIALENALSDFILNGDAQGVDPSLFFKTRFYKAQFTQPINSSAVRHFLSEGIKQTGVNPSSLFDVDYYVKIAEVKREHALTHFLTEGEQKNLNPTPYFDSGYFLQQCVRDGVQVTSAIRYYAEFPEKYHPSPFFDLSFYKLQLKENELTSWTSLEHYLLFGEGQGLIPTPYFDKHYYQSQVKEALEVIAKPLRHYLLFGEKEGLIPTLFFDPEYYREKYLTDPKDKNTIPIRHFFQFGAALGNNPSPFFDIKDYAKRRRVVLDRALYDFIVKGEKEGVNPSLWVDLDFYRSTLSLDVLDEIELNGGSVFRYFLTVGEQLGHSCSPFIDPLYYQTQLRKPLDTKRVVRYFLMEGEAQAYSPCLFFDNEYYAVQLNLDAQVLQLRHYLNAEKKKNPSLFFNTDFYLTQISSEDKEKIQQGKDIALRHFLMVGEKNGLNCSPYFDHAFCLKQIKPPIKISAIRYCLVEDINSEINPNPLFDNSFYRKQVGNRKTAQPLIRDYLQKGSNEKLNPSPYFDDTFYQKSYSDFLDKGKEEGDIPTPYFEAEFYKEQLSPSELNKINDGSISAFWHFITIGKSLNLQPTPLYDGMDPSGIYRPSPYFDKSFYLDQFSETEKKQIEAENAFSHFLSKGQKMGRNPSAFFEVGYYSLKYHVPKERALQHFILNKNKIALIPTPFFALKDTNNFIHQIQNWQKKFRQEYPNHPIIDFLLLNPTCSITVTTVKNSDIPIKVEIEQIGDNERFLAYQRLIKIANVTSNQVDTDKVSGQDCLSLTQFDTVIPIFEQLKVMDALINAGYDSATTITFSTQEAFVEKTKNFFSSETNAPAFYDKAKKVSVELSLHYLANYQSSSPYLSAGIAFDTKASEENHFNEQDYLDVDPDNSIYSHSAYFFDLIRIVDQYIKVNSSVPDLRERRPDLYEIPLDAAHCNYEVTHLQIVNYVLANWYLTKIGTPIKEILSYDERIKHCEEQAFESITQLKQIFISPFVLPLVSTRLYLQEFDLTLFQCFRSSFPTENILEIFDSNLNVALAFLNCSLIELNWLKFVLEPESINQDKAIASLLIEPKCDSKTFYQVTGLKRSNLTDLIPIEENINDHNRNTFKQLRINQGEEAPIAFSVNAAARTEAIIHLTPLRLQRISLLKFYANKLGITLFEMSSVLTLLSNHPDFIEQDIKLLATLKWLKEKSVGALSLSDFYKMVTPMAPSNDAPKEILKTLNKLFTSDDASNNLDTKTKAQVLLAYLAKNFNFNGTDIVILLDKNFITQFKTDSMLLSWFRQISLMVKLTGLSISQLLVANQLLREENNSNLSTLQKLFNTFNADKVPSLQIIFELFRLLSLSLWLTQNKIDVNVLFLILNGYSISDTKPLEQLNKDLQALLTQKSESIDSSICQKLADFLKIDFAMMSKFLKALAGETPIQFYILNQERTIHKTHLVILQRLVMLTNLLRLTHSDIDIFLKIIGDKIHHFYFVDLEEIKLLVKLKNLQADFKDPNNEFLNDMNKITIWDPELLQMVKKLLALSPENIADSINALAYLQQVMTIVMQLNKNIYLYRHIVSLVKTTPNEEFKQYEMASNLFHHINQPKPTDRIIKQIETRKRDVLVQQTLIQLKDQKISTRSDLSEYFLIDVEMTGDVFTSPISQGIGTVQLYLQRVRLKIEDGVTNTIPPSWWKWLESYSVWSLNRKVLLYPENFLKPDLRQSQSPEFSTLVRTLVKGSLDKDSIESAMKIYMESFVKLGDLVHCQACLSSSPNETDPFYLFARTRKTPPEYFYRTVSCKDSKIINWGYWNKIEVPINSRLITPVYAFNRLFIFWVDAQTRQQKESSEIINCIDYRVQYSYLGSSGMWQSPEVLGQKTNQDIATFLTSKPNNSDSNTNQSQKAPPPPIEHNQMKWVSNDYVVGIQKVVSTPSSKENPVIAFRLNKVAAVFKDNTIKIQYPVNDFPPPSPPPTFFKEEKFTLLTQLSGELNEALHFTASTLNPLLGVQDIYNSQCYGVDCSDPGTTGLNNPIDELLPVTPKLKPTQDSDKIVINETFTLYTNILTSTGTVCEDYLIQKDNNTPIILSAANQTHQLYQKLLSSSATVKEIYSSESLLKKEDFDGSYGNYLWEIFFYIPSLVASRLNGDQSFLEAREWFHCIFDPTQITGEKFLFPPLKNLSAKITDITEKNLIDIYHEHAFEPHDIARLHPLAYKKFMVMSYISNLIDWGDQLFSQNTRETITGASNLYMMANDLLGPRPEALQVVDDQTSALTMGQYMEGRSFLHPTTVSIFKKLENDREVVLYDETQEQSELIEFNPYFEIPENTSLIAYWDKVSDRLNKIRRGLNSEGQKQDLPLFSREIDSLTSAIAAFDGKNAPQMNRPFYRFQVMVDYAKSFVNQVMQMNNTLLSLLEKQDAENFVLLSNKHQLALLDLMTNVKQKQKDESGYVLDQAKNNLQIVQGRKKYYQELIDQGLSEEEKKAEQLRTEAFKRNEAAKPLAALSQVLMAVPQTEVGFSGVGAYLVTSFGGVQFGGIASTAATILEMVADNFNHEAEQLLAQDSYKRRSAEWNFQLDQATKDEIAAQKQIDIAQAQCDIAQLDLDLHRKSIQQQQELFQYYQTKFTNAALYSWMVSQLQVLYRQAYDLAFDTANLAVHAFNFELKYRPGADFNLKDNYEPGYKGLLAGEFLIAQINRMEKAYLDNNRRVFEIEKNISIKKMDEKKFEAFKNNKTDPPGTLEFSLTKEMFDEDFNGHDYRRIKSLRVSIPSLAKPYQNLNFVLTQKGSMIKEKEDCPFGGEQIIISSGINDTGTFQNVDARYAPFEGTGVISTWTLSVGGKVDVVLLKSISDIIIQMQYTAMPAAAKSDLEEEPKAPKGSIATRESNNNNQNFALMDSMSTKSKSASTSLPNFLSNKNLSGAKNSTFFKAVPIQPKPSIKTTSLASESSSKPISVPGLFAVKKEEAPEKQKSTLTADGVFSRSYQLARFENDFMSDMQKIAEDKPKWLILHLEKDKNNSAEVIINIEYVTSENNNEDGNINLSASWEDPKKLIDKRTAEVLKKTLNEGLFRLTSGQLIWKNESTSSPIHTVSI